MSHITRESENEECDQEYLRQKRIKDFYDDEPLFAPIRPIDFDSEGRPVWE